jgi:hypothetical protein
MLVRRKARATKDVPGNDPLRAFSSCLKGLPNLLSSRRCRCRSGCCRRRGSSGWRRRRASCGWFASRLFSPVARRNHRQCQRSNTRENEAVDVHTARSSLKRDMCVRCQTDTDIRRLCGRQQSMCKTVSSLFVAACRTPPCFNQFSYEINQHIHPGGYQRNRVV